MQNNRNSSYVYKIVFVGVMSAIVFVTTWFFRIPFLTSYLHFANAACLLAGMLFGPLYGGLSAGLGSGLYDMLIFGDDILNSSITFISKFAMAFVCGLIIRGGKNPTGKTRNIIAGTVGAITYIILYLLRTMVFQHFVYGNSWAATFVIMGNNLLASLMNAAFAVIVSVILHTAVRPALGKSGALKAFNEKK